MNTREGWLKRAGVEMAPMLEKAGAPMPEKWAVSVGFPMKRSWDAECWDKSVSLGERYEIFISPELVEPIKVLDTLLHEMTHAAVGSEHKHKGPFVKTVRKLGLAGKATATYAEPGSPLHDTLTKLAEKLGPYPHEGMKPRPKKEAQGWFLLKLVSPENPDFKFTCAPRLVEEYGMPRDPWGNEMVINEKGTEQ